MLGLATRVERLGAATRLHASRALLGRPLYYASCYAVGGVLVDSLFPRAAGAAARFAREAGVEAVLTTHHHEDHVGGHGALHAQGLPLHAPEATIARLTRRRQRIPPYRHLVWGTPAPLEAPVQAVPAAGRFEVAGRGFEAIPTPGHAFDHVAYLDEATGLLLTGDAFVPRLTVARPVEDVAQWRASMARLADVDARALLPGHGPVSERPREALEAATAWLDALERRARKLRARGMSVRRVRRELLGREPMLYWFSGGEFSGANLIRGLLGEAGGRSGRGSSAPQR